MKTKDVRTLPPERRELAKLALSFKSNNPPAKPGAFDCWSLKGA
jgi:hypothetical protein